MSSEIDGRDLVDFQENRNIKTETIPSTRGTIFDENNNPLAQSLSSYKVIAYLEEARTTNDAYPRHVVEVSETAALLSPILGKTTSTLENLLSRDLYQIQLSNSINQITKDEIEDLNIPGIDFIEGPMRFYPHSRFASYEIGYSRVNDEGVMTGEMGLEMAFDDYLQGTDGIYQYESDLRGYKILNGYEDVVEPVEGKDVYTTINRNIQIAVEIALTDSVEKYAPDSIMMIVADAKTGKILASSSRPSFDPNIRNIESYLNPIIEFPFEPGSTMKIYTYAAAIDQGVYNGSDTYLSGEYQVFDDVVRDWKREGWGVIDYDLGFALSSNVGIAHLVDEYLSRDILDEYFTRFGFGEVTGVELPREKAGKINFKYPIEVVTAGFGQGILTTPVQHIQALTAFANDGVMYAPYLVDKVVDPSTGEVVYEAEENELGQVIKPETVSQMIELMDDVVNGERSTGGWFAVDGYDVIGKTGTAQIANPNGPGYLSGPNDYIYSFSGMFPKEDPQIIIYAASIRPKVGTLNKRSVSDPVTTVVETIGKYFNINSKSSVDIEETDFEVTLDTYMSHDVFEVKDELEATGVSVYVFGNGEQVVSQSPKAYSTISLNEKVFLKTNDSNYLLPNLSEWSKNDVLRLCEFLELEVELIGNGYVKTQSVPENTLVSEITDFVVEFTGYEGIEDNSSPNE
jgi:penicillin-binding protein 2B